MKIKVNDNVKIITGKDRGKTGKVLHVIAPKNPRAKSRIVVEGLNLKYKHIRPKNEREKGQRIMFPYPLDISNCILICPKCGQATRVSYQKINNQNETAKKKTIKQRICKKCQAVI
ncbi:MAG TPA: 50S ribosomal protein L24 [Candidatus Paceibacterota bacterium]|nr:50S ribosomal protein L24 [Candidatus Paceibacterota bacterium]